MRPDCPIQTKPSALPWSRRHTNRLHALTFPAAGFVRRTARRNYFRLAKPEATTPPLPSSRFNGSGLVVLYTQRSAISGVSARYTDMHFVSLSQGQRSCGNRRLESSFLARVLVRSRSVVKPAPAFPVGYSPVSGEAHPSLLRTEPPAREPFRCGVPGARLFQLKHVAEP